MNEHRWLFDVEAAMAYPSNKPPFTPEQESAIRRMAKQEALRMRLQGDRKVCFIAGPMGLRAYDAELGWLELESSQSSPGREK